MEEDPAADEDEEEDEAREGLEPLAGMEVGAREESRFSTRILPILGVADEGKEG